MRLYDNSIFVTGSNSKLLSKEFTKEFSGRYVSFRIRPFVYKEIIDYSKELNIDYNISDYLICGGFPKRFEFEKMDDQIKYLTEINNYVLKSNSRIFSSRSIENYLKNEHVEGSINTIIKYLNYLEEAYIIDRIKPYSTKTKSELSYYFKIYNSDVCFNSIRCMDNRYDLSHNLENIIYNELLYMGYNINEKKLDFLAFKNNRKYYIQVAYTVVDDKIYEREFNAFASLDNSAKKVLITNDDIDYSTSTVIHLKLKDFLLLDSLENL